LQPRFPGCYQPHRPADLGYYDLRVPEVRARQTELAGEQAIDDFVWLVTRRCSSTGPPSYPMLAGPPISGGRGLYGPVSVSRGFSGWTARQESGVIPAGWASTRRSSSSPDGGRSLGPYADPPVVLEPPPAPDRARYGQHRVFSYPELVANVARRPVVPWVRLRGVTRMRDTSNRTSTVGTPICRRPGGRVNGG
jgi:hypothetical protein